MTTENKVIIPRHLLLTRMYCQKYKEYSTPSSFDLNLHIVVKNVKLLSSQQRQAHRDQQLSRIIEAYIRVAQALSELTAEGVEYQDTYEKNRLTFLFKHHTEIEQHIIKSERIPYRFPFLS